MIVVQCGGAGNRLKEVRICFDKGGDFRACGRNENQARLCSAAPHVCATRAPRRRRAARLGSARTAGRRTARDLRCLPTRCPAPGASGGCRSCRTLRSRCLRISVPCCDPSPMTMCATWPAVVPCAPCSPASSPTSASWSARDGGRLTIRCSYAAESIAIGASIACDGACLTATEVAPAGSGCALHGRRLQRDAEQDHARRLAARPAHQPGARAQGRRRAGRAHRGGPCRRRRPHRRHPPRRRIAALHGGGARRACPLHRLQGLGGARRHLAHRQ